MKILRYLLYFYTVSSIFPVNAQDSSFEWLKQIGGNDNVFGFSLCTDNIGNVYNIGIFEGSVDFDPGHRSFNLVSTSRQSDGFIQKLDSNGNFIWVKQFQRTVPTSIKSDQLHNIYITGRFSDNTDFDPGLNTSMLNSKGNMDVFILKLDSSGSFIWAKSFGNVNSDFGNSISLDAHNNVYVTGSFQGTVDFDPGNSTVNKTSRGDDDIYVLKLDSNGNFKWVKQMGGLGHDVGNSIQTDKYGNLYSTGLFEETVDFDPSAGKNNFTSEGNHDIYIQKLDSTGKFIWCKKMGGIYADVGYSLLIDHIGNVYSTGYFTDTVDFDPNSGISELKTNGLEDIFVQKLDSNGNFLWAKSIGGKQSDKAYSISINSIENIYITGTYKSEVDFNPASSAKKLVSNAAYDSYILKLDSSGKFLSVKNLGSNTRSKGNCVVTDKNDNTYANGHFGGDINYKDNSAVIKQVISKGLEDAYLTKIKKCKNSNKTDKIQSCLPYTWINGKTYFKNTRNVNDTLLNSEGCYNITSLDLTINNPDTSVIQTNDTLTAIFSNGTYKWLDCNNNYSPIPGANSQQFIPLESGSYALEISNTVCTDTSSCYITVTGLQERKINNKIIVTPNPTLGKFNIIFETKLESVTIKLKSLTGQLISTKSYQNCNIIPMNLNYSNGIYIIEIIEINGNIISSKILKQ